MKQCKQCGEIKPLSSYRHYYAGRKGTYTRCKSCEKINSRYKYLKGKDANNDSEIKEIEKIEMLYDALRMCGLEPPNTATDNKNDVQSLVDSLLKTHRNGAAEPLDLVEWLTVELTEEPEYYQDTVYEQLKKRYRPILKIDTTTMLPIYDDTHKETLSNILDRFDAYEDAYYKGGTK